MNVESAIFMLINENKKLVQKQGVSEYSRCKDRLINTLIDYVKESEKMREQMPGLLERQKLLFRVILALEQLPFIYKPELFYPLPNKWIEAYLFGECQLVRNHFNESGEEEVSEDPHTKLIDLLNFYFRYKENEIAG